MPPRPGSVGTSPRVGTAQAEWEVPAALGGVGAGPTVLSQLLLSRLWPWASTSSGNTCFHTNTAHAGELTASQHRVFLP